MSDSTFDEAGNFVRGFARLASMKPGGRSFVLAIIDEQPIANAQAIRLEANGWIRSDGARAIAARLLALADEIDPPVDERQVLFDNAYSPDQPKCPGCGCHPNGYHTETCDAMKKLQGHA